MSRNIKTALAAMAVLTAIGTTSSMALDYQAVVKQFQPYAYWAFNETAGIDILADATGNGRYCVAQAGTTQGQESPIVADVVSNTAIAFDGASRMVPNGINFKSDHVTMLVWLKPAAEHTNFNEVMFDRSSSACGIDLVENQVGYHWNDGAATYNYRSGLYMTVNEWQFVAMVVTPTEATFYLGDKNGNLQTAVNVGDHGVGTFGSKFGIGGHESDANRYYTGIIDEPALFDKALSAGNIEAIYKAGLNKMIAPVNVTVSSSLSPFYAGEGTLTSDYTAIFPEFQWYLDGKAIEGANADTLSGNLAAGSYTLKVTNSAGSATSEAFTIEAAKAPTITVNPVGGTRCEYGRAYMTVEAVGSLPFTYQWKLNGKDLEGANAATLSVLNIDTSMAGNYTCVVSNSTGSATSSAATLNVVAVEKGTFAEAIMQRNPIAYYRLDDPLNDDGEWDEETETYITGTAFDYAGGNNGLYHDVYNTAKVAGAIAQDSNKAVHFGEYAGPDSEGKIVGGSFVSTPLQLNETTKSGFTTMGWLRRDSAYGDFTTRGGYFGQNDLNEFGDGNDANTIECWCAGPGQIKVPHGFKDKEWTLIVLTYDTDHNLTLYLNGVVVGTKNGTLSATEGLGYYFNIGGGGIFNSPTSNMDFFKGDIDEVAMFDTFMTEEDVMDFYARGIYGPGAAPVIVNQPGNASALENEEHQWSMSVTASGSSPITYQWSKDGKEIEGATDRTYIGYSTADYVGSYTVTVSNPYGSVTSSAATFTLHVPVAGSYEATIIDLDPYAYWRLGEANGATTANELINGFQGTYNTAQTPGQPGVIKGDKDTSVYFDGSSYITTTGLNKEVANLTLLCWIKPQAAIADFTELLFDRGSSAVGMDIAENQLCYHWNDARHDFRSGLYITQNEWQFVALVGTPTGATFYLGTMDGRISKSVHTVALDPAKLTSSFVIGGGTTIAERRLNGLIDEPAVFTYAMTDAQIASVFAAGIYGSSTAPFFESVSEGFSGFVNDNLTLSCTAAGSQPMTYQWYKDGQIIEGATSPVITKSAEFSDNGTYTVVATNPVGSATSTAITVEVAYRPISIDLTGPEYELWAHLPFNGDYADVSGNGNDAYPIGDIPFVDGPFGQAIQVSTDAENAEFNYLALYNAEFIMGDKPLTVSFWSKIRSETPNLPWFYNRIVSDSASTGIGLCPDTTGRWSFYWVSSDGNNVYGDGVYGPENLLTAEEWHNVVLVYDPAKKSIKVFVDGGLPTSFDTSNLHLDQEGVTLDYYTNPYLNIGQDGAGVYEASTTWEMADFGLWRTAIKDVEARSIYYAGINGNSFDKIVPGKAPSVVTQPNFGQEFYQNDAKSVSLSVVCSGSEPFDITWTKDGQPIEQTGATIEIALTEEAAGAYQANISNAFGECKSEKTTLAFRTPVGDYENEIVALNPIAYWRLGEAEGATTAFDFVCGQNGTYNINTPQVLGVTGALFEDANTAVTFQSNGTDASYINAPLNFSSENVTMIAWVKRNGSQVDYTEIIFDRTSLAYGIDLVGNKLRYHWADKYYGTDTGLTLEDGVWNMCAIVVTPEKATFYLGDSQGNLNIAENVAEHLVGNFGSKFVIGGSTAHLNRALKGDIDEPAVFDYALTKDQITKLYTIGLLGAGAPPVIGTQPESALEIYPNNGKIAMSIKVSGAEPIEVEWFLNGNATGLTGATIEIERSLANAGEWTATASNAYGTVTSEAATVSFYEAASKYEAYIASLDPWGYWRLGEQPGATTITEHAHNQVGTYNANNGLGLEGAIAKDSDTAVSFTGALLGSAEYSSILIPNFAMGQVTEATYLVWLKRDGNQVGYSPILMSRGSEGTSGGSGLNFRTDNQLGYHWNDKNNTYSFVTGLTPEDGEWNMAALVITPTSATFYLGDSQGNLSSAVNEVAHDTVNVIGMLLGGQPTTSMRDRQYKGLLDEPAIFNYALSEEQIKQAYTIGRGGDVPVGDLTIEWSTDGTTLDLTWEDGSLEYSNDLVNWIGVDAASPFSYTISTDENVYFRLVK